MPKLKIPKTVRPLLEELESECAKFDQMTGQLAEKGVEFTAAVSLGADRERVRERIASVAYRIREECNGNAERKRKLQARYR